MKYISIRFKRKNFFVINSGHKQKNMPGLDNKNNYTKKIGQIPLALNWEVLV